MFRQGMFRHLATVQQRPFSAAAAAANQARTGISLRPNFFDSRTDDGVDPAYFTGNPEYYKLAAQVNELHRVHRLHAVARDEKINYPVWYSPSELDRFAGIHMSQAQAKDLYKKLDLLFGHAIRNHTVYDFLRRLAKARFDELLSNEKKRFIEVADDGTAAATASRKTAKVSADIAPGEGLIYVNGRPLHDFFDNILYRKAVMRPLEVVGASTKFNVWAKAVDGGQKSQAEAISVAIARALTAFEDESIDQTQLQRYVKIDYRQNERKKTGQPGARKKNQWLRR